MARCIEDLLLDGALWEEVVNGQHLFVENDVTYLLSAYEYAEHASDGSSFACTLADGGLVSTSTIVGERVDMTIDWFSNDGSGGSVHERDRGVVERGPRARTAMGKAALPRGT